MFKDLLVYEKVRSNKEALGFYLAHLTLLILVAFLLGFMLGDNSLSIEENYQVGLKAGQIFVIIACLFLSFVVLYKKQRLSNFGMVIVALLSGIAAAFLGGFLGLIPVSYLTTIHSENS